MGYMRHHAIIVTCFDEQTKSVRDRVLDIIDANRDEDNDTVLNVSEIVESGVNGYQSFLIAPDGSKEGWAMSNHGDSVREKIVDFLTTKSLDYALVQYGDEDGDNRVLFASGTFPEVVEAYWVVKINPGQYRHFEGDLVTVVGMAENEDGKEVVVYRRNYKLYTMPANEFVEIVDVDEGVQRFTEVA